MVDTQVLALEARKKASTRTPPCSAAAGGAGPGAGLRLLEKEVGPQVTEAAVKARYDKDIAGKPAVQEVHARHILVADEATAKKIIAELKKGGDFAALSKQYSKDPGAAQQGGDLGLFKKGDMVPEFSDAAFALKDKEVDPTPVHTQFGWHVIQMLEHRTAPPPTSSRRSEELRQKMIQEAVQKAVAQARGRGDGGEIQPGRLAGQGDRSRRSRRPRSNAPALSNQHLAEADG